MEYSVEQVTKAERISQLIARFMFGTISPEEHDELDEWVGENDENMRLFEEMTKGDIE